jgi:uncharacterized protein (TIGR00297 family)
LDAREIRRKAVHMGVGLLAFALRFLGPLGGALCAASAVLFNWLLLPRLGGRALLRDGEEERGHSIGIRLYPVTVLLLVLLFWRRLEIAAAAWGILAFGDGMASVAGMTWGRAKLPWNPRKSWAGTLAYWFFGSVAAAALLVWTAPGRYEVPFAIAIAAVATLAAAILESQPQGLDDNLGVPLFAGVLLWALSLAQPGWQVWLERLLDAEHPTLLVRVLLGAGINALLAMAGYLTGGVDRSGVAVGWLLGTVLYAFADWRGYVLLLAFYILGTACTRIGFAGKAAAGIAQDKGGRRGARNALAKVSVPTAAAVFAALTPLQFPFAMAVAGAFATVTADTVSSEIGKAFGRRTFLITNLRLVPRGTDGAVSVEGTLAGILASLLVAALGVATGYVGVAALWLVPAAAFVATNIESILGATLEKRGLLDNEAVNFLNSLTGAGLAGLGAWALVAL